MIPRRSALIGTGLLAAAPVLFAACKAPAPDRSGAFQLPPSHHRWGSAELLRLLESEPDRFGDLLPVADELRLKIELAVVRPAEGAAPTLERYSYSSGPEYFYPASTVKTCAAIAAAQAMEALAKSGLDVGLDSPLRYQPLFPGEVVEDSDPSHGDGGTITLGHDMRKVFLVSDNEAYNRLYEFAGQQGVNESMRSAGLTSSRIVHRLSEFRSPLDQLRTPRIEILKAGAPVAVIPERRSVFVETNDDLSGISIGVGRLSGGEVVDGPMSFAQKNFIHLRDLQDMHIMLLRPDIEIPGRPATDGIALSPATREFMASAMAQTPSASVDPIYPAVEYPDDYSKFLGPGVWKVVPKEHAVIRDKVGRAYGFSTTNSEVIDTRTGASYFLAATIYLNPNGVLNDGVYGYDRADQFFADLGEVISRFVFERGDS